MKQQFDWPAIFTMLDSGRTPAEIAKQPGAPTRQAIAKQIKKRELGNQTKGQVVAKRLPITLGKNTPETKQIILDKIANGAPYTLAAQAAGVSDRTVRHWRANDADFAAAVDTARAWHLAQMAGYISEAAPRDWKAAAWILERARETREEFGKQDSMPPVTVRINIERGD